MGQVIPMETSDLGRRLVIPTGFRLTGQNELVTKDFLVFDFIRHCWVPVNEEEIGQRAHVIGMYVITKRIYE